jgi:hypothetical protein
MRGQADTTFSLFVLCMKFVKTENKVVAELKKNYFDKRDCKDVSDFGVRIQERTLSVAPFIKLSTCSFTADTNTLYIDTINSTDTIMHR